MAKKKNDLKLIKQVILLQLLLSTLLQKVLLLKDKLNNPDKGCLLLLLLIKHWDKLLKVFVPTKEDIYNDNTDDFGYSLTPHITILYGFLDRLNIDKLKLQLYLIPTDNIKPKITGMSLFELLKYDVLKFDVECKLLVNMNKQIAKNFKYSNDYSKYIPHITIAYLLPGTGKKYVKNIKLFYPKVKLYIYNYKNVDTLLIPLKLK